MSISAQHGLNIKTSNQLVELLMIFIYQFYLWDVPSLDFSFLVKAHLSWLAFSMGEFIFLIIAVEHNEIWCKCTGVSGAQGLLWKAKAKKNGTYIVNIINFFLIVQLKTVSSPSFPALLVHPTTTHYFWCNL